MKPSDFLAVFLFLISEALLSLYFYIEFIKQRPRTSESENLACLSLFIAGSII